MPKTAALRAAVFKIFGKNRWGGGENLPPPSNARVKENENFACSCRSFMTSYYSIRGLKERRSTLKGRAIEF